MAAGCKAISSLAGIFCLSVLWIKSGSRGKGEGLEGRDREKGRKSSKVSNIYRFPGSLCVLNGSLSKRAQGWSDKITQ